MKIDNRIIICILALLLCVGIVHAGDKYTNGIRFDGENATGGNLYINADIFLHTNTGQSVTGAGTWSNITFTHDVGEKHNIIHTYNDDTNDTITVIYTGVYDFKYAVNFNNTNANPDDYAYLRIAINGVEHNGSGIATYLSKQNAHRTLSGCTRAELTAGDTINLQFTITSTDTNVEAQKYTLQALKTPLLIFHPGWIRPVP